MLREARIHPVHHKRVNRAVGVVVIGKKKGRRHGVKFLIVHRHVA